MSRVFKLTANEILARTEMNVDGSGDALAGQ